jgi:hypothetical protein
MTLPKMRDIKDKDFIFSLWAILFLTLPGIAGIFLFNETLFFKLNWITLILLAGSFLFPFVILNTILIDSWYDIHLKDKDGIFKSFLASTMITGLIAYVGIFIRHFFPGWFPGLTTFKNAIILNSTLFVIFVVVVIPLRNKFRKSKGISKR